MSTTRETLGEVSDQMGVTIDVLSKLTRAISLHQEIIKLALPLAELEGQAVELLKESKRVNFHNVHLLKNWRKRADALLTQIEALKAKEGTVRAA